MADAKRRYRGIFPVVPTTFDEQGALDLPSQLRAIDFMIDAGSDGLCILANFSEQFVLSDEEREILTTAILKHVAGRVPVIVTTTHYSSHVCAQRSRKAQDQGAAMVMIQDAPAAGTPLSAPFLARMATEIAQVSYFKIETAGAAQKLRDLIRLGGDAIEGPWDGEEAITLLADLDAGATGSMTGGGYADGIKPIVHDYLAGNREAAIERYNQWLPLINYENRQCGLLACKALMKEGGIIDCEAPRHPIMPLSRETRAGLLDVARRLDPLVLRWGK
jgi:4-hydroxy-tetrahydrodipicolinate synthase/2-keto-3-deoxy-L-arabinonate dehydratase